MFYLFWIAAIAIAIVPVQLEKYDVIIIPVGKMPLKPRQLDFILTNSKKSGWRPKQNYKLDIEQYEDASEMPSIDHFDYKDRQATSRGEVFEASLAFEDAKPYLKTDEKRYVKALDKSVKYRGKNERSIEQQNAGALSYDESNYGIDKIVGGTEVDINLYPYHVAYGTNCGGAIIDQKWVMTAGHCGKKPYIRVGSKYLNQGKKVSVKDSHIHPMWAAKTKEHPFDFDFQVLELEEPLKFDENVQPVKIAHIEDMVIGKVVTVTGWGNTEENGPYSNVLRAVRVPIISKENCQRVPFPYFRGGLTARMFCAGFQEGKKDACQGDSGGPAVAYDRLLGMVSFGYGCATPGSYGVYSKVAKVRGWIEQTTGLKLS